MNLDPVFQLLNFTKVFPKVLIKLHNTNVFQSMNSVFHGPFISFSLIDQPDFFLFCHNYTPIETTIKSRPAVKLQMIAKPEIEHFISFTSKETAEDFIVAFFTVNAKIEQFITDGRIQGFSSREENNIYGVELNIDEEKLMRFELELFPTELHVKIRGEAHKAKIISQKKKFKDIVMKFSQDFRINPLFESPKVVDELAICTNCFEVADKTQKFLVVFRTPQSMLNFALAAYLTNLRLLTSSGNAPSSMFGPRTSSQPIKPAMQTPAQPQKSNSTHANQTNSTQNQPKEAEKNTQKPEIRQETKEIVQKNSQNEDKEQRSGKSNSSDVKNSETPIKEKKRPKKIDVNEKVEIPAIAPITPTQSIRENSSGSFCPPSRIKAVSSDARIQIDDVLIMPKNSALMEFTKSSKKNDDFMLEVDSILERERRETIKQVREIRNLRERRSTVKKRASFLNKDGQQQAKPNHPGVKFNALPALPRNNKRNNPSQLSSDIQNSPKSEIVAKQRKRKPTFKLSVASIDVGEIKPIDNIVVQIKECDDDSINKNAALNAKKSYTFLPNGPSTKPIAAPKLERVVNVLKDIRKPEKPTIPDFSLYIDDLKKPPPQLASKSIEAVLDKAISSLAEFDNDFSFKSSTNDNFMTENSIIIQNTLSHFEELKIDDFSCFGAAELEARSIIETPQPPNSHFLHQLSIVIEQLNSQELTDVYLDSNVGLDLAQLFASLWLNGLKGESLIPAFTEFLMFVPNLSKTVDRASKETDKLCQASIISAFLLNTTWIVPVLREIKRRDRWITKYYYESALINSENDLDLILSLLVPIMNHVKFRISVRSSILSTASIEFMTRYILTPAYGYLEVQPYLNNAEMLTAISNQFGYGLKNYAKIKIGQGTPQISFIMDVVSNWRGKKDEDFELFSKTSQFIFGQFTIGQKNTQLNDFIKFAMEKNMLAKWLIYLLHSRSVAEKYYEEESLFRDSGRAYHVIAAIIKFSKVSN
ncbi:hypothetical protein TRFO_12831 [Tritrichomonas foetus]|uniref:RUN domain-containing protein n=1 Tax=Tritrichomonas foetus TaxID=1144522 RepID=A0A1J4L4T0_9EUKA|nr:hypothetical protein TRFO_12831 [Tritrichomonas foetus]|eukprot:OHT16942.1 hypothetical protein TRFO_12831 [Tritrichomonas foetus]